MQTQANLRAKLRKVRAVADDARGNAHMRAMAQAKAAEMEEELRRMEAEEGFIPEEEPEGEERFCFYHFVPDYMELVEEGRTLVKRQNTTMWQLGELASRVQTKYGAGALQDFAADIDYGYETLKRASTVWWAWHDYIGPLGSRGPNLPKYQVCRSLAPLPNRFDLLRRKPNMTVKQAQKYARDWRAKHTPHEPAEELYALLQQHKLLLLIGETITQADQLPDDLRAKLIERGTLIFDRLGQLLAALARKQLQ